MGLPDGMKIRNCRPSDHAGIVAVMKGWWGGRDLTHMLPKLFLNHFYNTSFLVEKKGILVAFLVGFLSPSVKQEGYIHFVGVDPKYQGQGIGRYIYDRFFRICREGQRSVIRACTSPINQGSIAFHTRMGFTIIKGNAEMEGVQVTLDYNKPDDPKVLFEKKL